MLSKAKTKFIRSLELKKNRQSEGLFVAEGPKVVGDLLPYFRVRLVVATQAWLRHGSVPAHTEVIEVTEEELSKASFLKTPQEVLAVFQLPDVRSFNFSPSVSGLSLVLDDVQDPGNLGTIIRTADWFGIRQIVCSQGTADAFSPKVVQATMGALARVKVYYSDLPSFLAQMPNGTPVYGTFLEGKDIYHTALSANGVIVMGNEGRGISDAVKALVSDKLFIPPYPADALTSESLNVGIATAITVSEFRRRPTP